MLFLFCTARTTARRRTGTSQHVQTDVGERNSVCGDKAERTGARIQSGLGHRIGQRRETRPGTPTKVQSNGQSARIAHLGESTAGIFKFHFILII